MDGKVTRPFQQARSAYGEGGHQGVDISGQPGETVRSAAAGTVIWIGELPRGRFISIAHEGGVRTSYLGLEGIDVVTGQRVARGQALGRLGGSRDPSSPGNHLHFDVFLNGCPVDPKAMAGATGMNAFVRLCPVEHEVSKQSEKQAPGSHAAQGDSYDVLPGAVKSETGLVKEGLRAIGGGLKSAWKWVSRGADSVWDRYCWPAIKKCGRWVSDAAKACWSNRWVKATIAGLAAAVLVVAGIIVAVITLPISLTCAVVAGIAATVACLGVALYYAATHPAGFSFLGCFLKSLSGGAAVAATALSMGSLGAAFSAGWAELGIAGVAKAALANALLSTVFEAGTSYLLTGRVSITRMAVAFGIGLISGPITKAMKEGILGSRLVQALLVSASEGRVGVTVSAGLLFLKESEGAMRGMLVLLKDGATAFGGKAAYLAFSGAFAVSCNISSCILNHKPITVSGALASFITGVVMGSVGLMFKGAGLEGILTKFKLLDTGVGRVFRTYSIKLITKTINKGMSSGLESQFKKVFREQEAAVIKEE